MGEAVGARGVAVGTGETLRCTLREGVTVGEAAGVLLSSSTGLGLPVRVAAVRGEGVGVSVGARAVGVGAMGEAVGIAGEAVGAWPVAVALAHRVLFLEEVGGGVRLGLAGLGLAASVAVAERAGVGEVLPVAPAVLALGREEGVAPAMGLGEASGDCVPAPALALPPPSLVPVTVALA